MANKRNLLRNIKSGWCGPHIAIRYQQRPLCPAYIADHPAASYHMALSVWDKNLINIQEQLMVFYLNNANRVLGHRLVSTGNATGCCIDVRLILSIALHSLATAVIVVHNHPSGKLTPSRADKLHTQRLRDALALIDVHLLDHLVISEQGFYSMLREGVL
ncbi:JAB domain-containing protein [Deminuibacter soli]|uniref:DNA repair protein n=1 Tax=Deminuibacter soli TaxID=2291815 RepID=A0A3E1NMJ0_9BACT|nr:JAB domain-containing protein [Deminuibacter soli]RFM29117.1 DNA repair protein [Deminuibacter soli]